MGRPKYSSTWRPSQNYDSDRALEAAQDVNNRTFSGRMNAGQAAVDLYQQYKDFMAQEKFYEETAKGIERQRILEHIREQLAPDQKINVLFDRDTNAVINIQRPGDGYFDTSGRLKYFQLEGDNEEGICPARQVPQTEQFDLIDREGHKTLRILDLYRPRRDEDAFDKDERAQERRESKSYKQMP